MSELSPEDEELLRQELEGLTAFYRRTALKIIRDAKAAKNKERWYPWRVIADDLFDYGVDIEPQALINRIGREAFSFTFALQVLAAMGVKQITIPQPPDELKLTFTRR